MSYAWFELASKASFSLEASTSGPVEVVVSLDDDFADDAILWRMTVETSSSASINVATDDARFFFGTHYFVRVEQLSSAAASGSLVLKQERHV